MATTLSFEQHLAGLERAAGRFAYHAARTDGGAAVPTCPGWTLDDLVVHVSVVHRWAEANLCGQRDGGPDEDDVRAAADLVDYFRDGYLALSSTLAQADPDVDAHVFLLDAPAPRDFWARRQCHETTIHAVDALSAALGRVPDAEECAIDVAFALDGIDELLAGFAPRHPTRILPGSGQTIAVTPTDGDRAWTIRSDEKLVTTQGAEPGADTVFSGTAAQLYLGLWNRGDEITETGRTGALGLWRNTEHVTWS